MPTWNEALRRAMQDPQLARALEESVMHQPDLKGPQPKTVRPTPTPSEPRCRLCRDRPHEIEEYSLATKVLLGVDRDPTPTEVDDYVRQQEPTYNTNTGAFWCTNCHVLQGMPEGKA